MGRHDKVMGSRGIVFAFALSVWVAGSSFVRAQEETDPTVSLEPQDEVEETQQEEAPEEELPKSVSPYRWRNIGPANMMGRISAIDALDSDYRHVLVGSASGGVFKSVNAGVTWRSICGECGSQSIGDVAMFQDDPKVIWIGTGEATNRNSVGWGDGIYKSEDGGETFSHVGLRETRQISEIATHPDDPNIVYVAAIGSLWGQSGERGVFKTIDGGETWRKLSSGLPNNGNIGATVVAVHPTEPDTVFVGLYERERSAWHMESGGPNGGIFKSTDGGETFRKIMSGLPTGETGQIDIDFYHADPSVMVAYVEASDELPFDLKIPGPGVYRSDNGGENWTYLHRNNSRPYYHGRVRIHPSNPDKIYMLARDFYYSEDGGKTFEQGRPWEGSGGDDHDMWLAPHDPDIWYMATDQGAYLTNDGGDTVLSFNNMTIGQFYAIGVDMREPFWVYGGLQDNGGWAIPSNSRDPQGILVDHAFEVNGGDGFHMQVDPMDWRTVYTTAHVGFFGRFDMQTREHIFITPAPETILNFKDHYDPDYDESPVNYSINPEERWIWRDIENRTINGANLPPQFRFNWNSPLVLSPTNPHTIYVGGNHVFKSVDRGETWRIISPDLTRNNPETRNSSDSGGLTKDATGAENHNTVYTIDPSPIDPALIWAGSDDGLVHVTQDGGTTWTDVTSAMPGLPAGAWISRVEASHHNPSVAYVAVDRHWWDDFEPYIFKTTDYGKSWVKIVDGIPAKTPGNSVYTIVEDPRDPNLLFVGTEFGAFVSTDAGGSWSRFMDNLPPVAVHDLIIHPRDDALIAGTHGRGIWIVDDVTPLRNAGTEKSDKVLDLFQPREAVMWRRVPKGRVQFDMKFVGENPHAGAAINYSLKEAPTEKVRITINDADTGLSKTWTEEAQEGANRTYWDFRFSPSQKEVEDHRVLLKKIAEVTKAALTGASTERDMAAIKHMQQDLLAGQRYPQLFEDETYTHTDGGGKLLLLE
ncbi:MAG: hypothetical protein AAF742_01060, partial [Pseudomonadota bacterium]